MIGNDIIDLDLARKESNWQRKGFLNKIFTENEQLLILNAQNPEIMIWSLWSRKEAVYKIYNRQTQIRGYFPLLLECIDLNIVDESVLGKVHINNLIYFTKTKITDQYINTIAVENVLDFDKVKILKNREKIQINNGVPNFYEKENRAPKPVSISHHGRFEQIISL